MEVIFEVREAEEGGYVARALGQSIFTEAETWDELRSNVMEVTGLHFEGVPEKPGGALEIRAVIPEGDVETDWLHAQPA